MLPIQVTLQYIREGVKESRRVVLSMDATVKETIVHMVGDLDLPIQDSSGPLHYQLLRQRQVLDSDQILFSVGVQDGDIMQLITVDANSTIGTDSGRALLGNLLSRLGGKAGSDPLPVGAILFDQAQNLRFELQHTRAMIGRADAKHGYPTESLDADLTELDPNRSVSRPHALIVYNVGEFTIRDLYSQHGLFLNGERLSPNKAHVLHNGDRLTFGTVELQFYCEGG